MAASSRLQVLKSLQARNCKYSKACKHATASALQTSCRQDASVLMHHGSTWWLKVAVKREEMLCGTLLPHLCNTGTCVHFSARHLHLSSSLTTGTPVASCGSWAPATTLLQCFTNCDAVVVGKLATCKTSYSQKSKGHHQTAAGQHQSTPVNTAPPGPMDQLACRTAYAAVATMGIKE